MQTKTVTAWELCEMVMEKLQNEPLNYCQYMWDVKKDNKHIAVYDISKKAQKDCGTAHCIGGWMRVIIGDPDLAMHRIAALLKVSFTDWARLTNAAAIGHPTNPKTPKAGTVKYAKLGMAHLQKWMLENEKHLHATCLQIKDTYARP